jgi:hypothetical protein
MKHEEIDIYYYRSQLRMTIPNEQTYLRVKPAWAAPLSRPINIWRCSTARTKRLRWSLIRRH